MSYMPISPYAQKQSHAIKAQAGIQFVYSTFFHNIRLKKSRSENPINVLSSRCTLFKKNTVNTLQKTNVQVVSKKKVRKK